MTDPVGSDVMDIDVDAHAPTTTESRDQPRTMSPISAGYSDPLLSCLVELSALLEHPRSSEALIAGLPHDGQRLTPSLAIRALERAMETDKKILLIAQKDEGDDDQGNRAESGMD